MNQIATQQTGLSLISSRLAERFNVGSAAGTEIIAVLRQTVFKSETPASDAQLMALLIVADQYGLNPFTKEIYAYPDKKNGIVAVVGVDGWLRIINEHPAFDGMDVVNSDKFVKADADAKDCPEYMDVVIHRKDRSHPTVTREYLDECYRPPFTVKNDRGGYKVPGPWQSHTKRMMRHKTIIQGGRIAFGFVGIYDEDEAGRILEAQNAEPVKATAKIDYSVQSKSAQQPKPDTAIVEGVIVDKATGEVLPEAAQDAQESTGAEPATDAKPATGSSAPAAANPNSVYPWPWPPEGHDMPPGQAKMLGARIRDAKLTPEQVEAGIGAPLSKASANDALQWIARQGA